jgi:hypothetical protein
MCLRDTYVISYKWSIILRLGTKKPKDAPSLSKEPTSTNNETDQRQPINQRVSHMPITMKAQHLEPSSMQHPKKKHRSDINCWNYMYKKTLQNNPRKKHQENMVWNHTKKIKKN